MPGTTISRSILEFSTDDAKFVSGVESAKKRARELDAEFKNTGKSAEGFGSQLKGLGGLAEAFGVSLSIAGVVAFGKSLLDAGDQIVKVADRTGLATDEVQRLQFIAEQSGNSLDDLTGAMSKLQVRLADGSAKAGIEALGLNFEKLRNESPYEQMSAVAEAIGKIENPTLRAQRATEVFGKAGTEVLPTLIANFKDLGDGAPVMSDSTVRALDTAGDAIGKFTRQVQVWAAEAYNYAGGLFDRLVAGAYRLVAGAYDSTAKLAALASKIPGASKLGLDQSLVTSLQGQAQWFRDAATAMTTSTAAAQTNRKAVAALAPAHDGAAKAARSLAAAEQALTQVTAEQQHILDLVAIARKHDADALKGAEDAYERQQTAIGAWIAKMPEAKLVLDNATAGVRSFVGAVEAVNTALVKTATIPAAVVKGPSLFEKMFGTPQQFGAQLGSSILAAIQGGGSVVNAAFGTVGQEIGTHFSESIGKSLLKDGAGILSKSLGGLLQAVLPGVGALLGPLMSKVWSGIKGLFGGNNQGRDLVKTFIAENFGDASELQRQLLALGPEYDRLWRGITQLGNNASTSEAQAAIDAVTKALEAHKQKVTEDAAASQAAVDQVRQAQQDAVDGAKANLQAIDAQIQQLQDSIKDEAPEEEMGIVERITREKIAAMQEQREAAAQTLNDLTAQMTAAVTDVGEAIRNLPDEIAIRLRVELEKSGGAGPTAVPMADGGFGRAIGPTFFYSAGNEDYAFSGEGRSFGGRFGGLQQQTIVFQLGERELQRVVTNGTPRDLFIRGVVR